MNPDFAKAQQQREEQARLAREANERLLQDAKEKLLIPQLWRILQLPGEPPPRGTGSCKSPFRTEKNASFSIFEDGRAFVDFTTRAGGDAVAFLGLATGLEGKSLLDKFRELAGVQSAENGKQTANQWKPTREERERRRRQAQEARRLEAVAAAARRQAGRIFSREWPEEQIIHESPLSVTGGEPQWQRMLGALYAPEDIIWTGQVHHSGPGYETHFRPVSEWLALDSPVPPHPMICPDVFSPGICSRSTANVTASPFIIIEADSTLGRKPETAGEVRENVRRNLAVLRWLARDLRWNLRAIVLTGGKSAHGWFERPPEVHIRELRAVAPSLGIDSSVFSPAHPVRLPGGPHEKTGNLSRLIYLG